MTNQSQVREIYLRVIDATIESVRDEMTERSANEDTLTSLELLKTRWAARLTKCHDFTDDPAIVDRPSASAARGGKKQAAGKGKKKLTPSGGMAIPVAQTPTTNPPSRNGVIPVAALTHATDEVVPLPPVPRVQGKPEPSLDDEVQEVKVEPPPAKRARTDAKPKPKDDGRVEHTGEDLDSSDDSDAQDDDSDEEAENLVLAQHDKVRKGQKWKVILREGIISIRGREYLFNKATCDLDF